MKILSEPSGGHCTVSLLLFKSPRSTRRKCFLWTFWSWEVLEICRLTQRVWNDTHCLNHSQFKGTGGSSPSSSYFPREGSLEETASVPAYLFLPRAFELTFHISSCAFVWDNCFPQNTFWGFVRFSKTQGGNYSTLSCSHGFVVPLYFTFFKTNPLKLIGMFLKTQLD